MPFLVFVLIFANLFLLVYVPYGWMAPLVPLTTVKELLDPVVWWMSLVAGVVTVVAGLVFKDFRKRIWAAASSVVDKPATHWALGIALALLSDGLLTVPKKVDAELLEGALPASSCCEYWTVMPADTVKARDGHLRIQGWLDRNESEQCQCRCAGASGRGSEARSTPDTPDDRVAEQANEDCVDSAHARRPVQLPAFQNGYYRVKVHRGIFGPFAPVRLIVRKRCDSPAAKTPFEFGDVIIPTPLKWCGDNRQRVEVCVETDARSPWAFDVYFAGQYAPTASGDRPDEKFGLWMRVGEGDPDHGDRCEPLRFF